MALLERHQRRLDGRARRITIDLDPTDDATHGAQQLTFFNGHYDRWCYLPLLAFLTFDQDAQYLCAAVLRPGNVPATRGTVGVLCRLLPLLRQAFPQARFLVRLDGGFATPEIFDFLDAERLRGGDGQERRVAAPRCATGSSNWGRTSSARSAAWSCTCRPPHRTSTPGGTSRWHSAPAPDRPQTAPVSRASRSPTANRARPWRSRPWTAPYPGLPHRQSVSIPPALDENDARRAVCATITPSEGPSWSLQE